MSGASRRDALRHGAVVAIGAVYALNAQSVFAGSKKTFSIPDSPMRLSRKVVRQLIDGNYLSVTRSWEILFASAGEGWRVSGEQLGVDVQAPEGLEALAEMERSRTVNEAFPLKLDPNGYIVANTPAERQVDLDKLAVAAKESISNFGGGAADHRRLEAFLFQMQQVSLSAMTHFPRDLFFPEDGELTESKVMDLPGGLTGRMELSYRASAHPGSGLLNASERSVITKIQGEELHSSEQWRLEKA